MEPPDPRAAADAFRFRGILPCVRFGTASDRYAGWIGQIYPAEYAARATARTRELDGERYRERTVPVDSVAHFFEHFDVLELDFPFYSPLLEPDGSPSRSYHTLARYADHAPGHASFVLKAPQAFSARGLRRGPRFEPNPDYLDARGYAERFLAPAADLLGPRLTGVLFEQEYQRAAGGPDPEAFADELDAFFEALPPGGPPTHVEVRSPHLQVPPFFAVLERHGLGHVLSHWTWLGPLRAQFAGAGGRFLPAGPDRDVLVRLLTPLNVRYADAYALAYPFDRPVDALTGAPSARPMIRDAVRLALRAAGEDVRVNVFANNRAWGNAPELARTVAHAILDGS